MMTFQQFNEAVSSLQELIKEQDELADKFYKLFEVSPCITIGNKLMESQFKLINHLCGMKEDNDLIQWWLFECSKGKDDACQICFDTPDGGKKKYTVNTIKQLYDYMIAEEANENV